MITNSSKFKMVRQLKETTYYPGLAYLSTFTSHKSLNSKQNMQQETGTSSCPRFNSVS